MSTPQARRIALDYWDEEGVWIAADRERRIRATGDTQQEVLDRLDRFVEIVIKDEDSPEAKSVRRASENLEAAYERNVTSDIVDEAVKWSRSG
jgi:predicted RNase H-like HicB family nuclease